MAGEASDWYVKAFGELYHVLYPRRDEASADREIVALVQMLKLTGTERVLDCCCGAGRHIKALLARRYDAWGIDLSMPLLCKACHHPEASGRVTRADIRRLPFRERFQVVLSLFTSFGYFLDDDQNRTALNQMHAALIPQGVLVIDHMNRRHLLNTIVSESHDICGEYEVIQRRRLEGNRVIKEVVISSLGVQETRITENVRLFDPDEMEAWFRSAGFKETRVFGSFLGDPLRDDSERMIVTGIKAGS